jgi:endonuclease YncB( thermonuclease family)
MPFKHHCKKAPLQGAFFVPGLLLCGGILASMLAASARAADCPADRISERVQVVHIYDGDTVKLRDGRRLRLIGINTPEVSHKGKAAQSMAEPARSALETLLDKHNRTLLLRHGKEQRDHYGRLLAHAFLDDGSNVAVHLLERGLATTLVVPPNTWAQDCYQSREDDARAMRRGLWALADYRPLESRSLSSATRGFRLVRGQVTEIRQSRHSVWLDLEGPLVIKVARRDLVNFEPGFPEKLLDRRIEVRGWIRKDDRGLRLNLRHPAAISVLDRQRR